MNIVLNGTIVELPENTHVDQLIESRKLEPQRVAVEINKQLVTRKNFASTIIREGDTIEIVTFVGGG